MIEELDEIIRNTEMSVEFASLKTEEAKSWIRVTLHFVRIYTGELDGDQNMPSAIKVFERECVRIIPECISGKLDSHVLLKMRHARHARWHRKISFHCKVGGRNHYFPYDLYEQAFKNWVGGTAAKEDRRIYVQEGAEVAFFFLGTGEKNRKTNHYGIQRYANDPSLSYNPIPYNLAALNSAQKVIFAIAQNEGGDPVGGYDTVNAYDQAALSVGLFHWNNDWLWELLNVYRENSRDDYLNLSRLLGIDLSRTSDSRQFVIDGRTYPVPQSGGIEELRRLKYVYRFLREAERPGFRAAQLAYAKRWIYEMLVDQKINGRTMGDYINSERAVALYVDMTVNAGRGEGIRRAKGAVSIVFGQMDPNNLNDNQKKTLEDSLVDAIKQERSGTGTVGTYSMSDPGLREGRIESTVLALNQARNTFDMGSLQ